MTFTVPVVVGVDPGGATTGLVVRAGTRLLEHATIDRKGLELPAYLDRVASWVVGARETFGAKVAVEDTIPPNPHLGLSNPAGIIAAAQVLGAVLLMAPAAVVVRPGGHGSPKASRAELLASYPPELVGDRETRGTGKLRHVRSAWDVAGMAAWLLRTGEAPA